MLPETFGVVTANLTTRFRVYGSMEGRVVRSLVFPTELQDPKLRWLLQEFRLLVNRSIRIALREGIRSRARLTKAAYRTLSAEHDVYKQYIPSAFEVALGVLKAYRRRVRRGKRTSAPYLRRPLLKAENQSYRIDRGTGRLRIPVRGTEGVQLTLPLSTWHRAILQDPTWGLGSLTVTSDRVVVVVRKDAPAPYEPAAAIALDTNEASLDGVVAGDGEAALVSLRFLDIRVVQATHFRRRRLLARKKANDRRVMRRLLRREGRREHHRIRQRLHIVSKSLVAAANDRAAAIVLEKLKMPQGGGSGRRMLRRLSSWPQGELRRQIEYKALAAGVPVLKVHPAWTSKTCPACGARRRDRVGQDFVCVVCNWEMDRQHNAGLNILKTALASDEALARAVRFRPGALRRDVVIPLCDLLAREGAREEPSGVESLAGMA